MAFDTSRIAAAYSSANATWCPSGVDLARHHVEKKYRPSWRNLLLHIYPALRREGQALASLPLPLLNRGCGEEQQRGFCEALIAQLERLGGRAREEERGAQGSGPKRPAVWGRLAVQQRVAPPGGGARLGQRNGGGGVAGPRVGQGLACRQRLSGGGLPPPAEPFHRRVRLQQLLHPASEQAHAGAGGRRARGGWAS